MKRYFFWGGVGAAVAVAALMAWRWESKPTPVEVRLSDEVICRLVQVDHDDLEITVENRAQRMPFAFSLNALCTSLDVWSEADGRWRSLTGSDTLKPAECSWMDSTVILPRTKLVAKFYIRYAPAELRSARRFRLRLDPRYWDPHDRLVSYTISHSVVTSPEFAFRVH